MLRWALFFLIAGLVLAVLGFGGIGGAFIGIAKILFFIAIAVFAVLMVMGNAYMTGQKRRRVRQDVLATLRQQVTFGLEGGGVAPVCLLSGGAAGLLAPQLNLEVKVVDNLVLEGLLVMARGD